VDEANAEPVVFQQPVSKYRRARRAELLGLTGLSTLFGLMVCATPLWPIGAFFAVAGVASFAIAQPILWNAEPPSVTIDASGITMRSWDLGITFKDRSRTMRLGWPDIALIEVDRGHGLNTSDLISVTVSPAAPERGPRIRFNPDSMAMTDVALAQALATFAPPRLADITDRRPTKRRES
jgi:hypothetical protein